MVLVAVLIIGAVGGAPAAYASCATEATASPYAFIGTVISTEKKDRVATVITDNGRQVTVLGTEGGGWFSGFSSADRRYALGGRYDSPSNQCRIAVPGQQIATATHQLAGPGLRPLEPVQGVPARLATCRRTSRFGGYLVFFGPVAAEIALDTCCSSVRLRQASCFSSSWVAKCRSSGGPPLEPANSAVRTAPIGQEGEWTVNPAEA